MALSPGGAGGPLSYQSGSSGEESERRWATCPAGCRWGSRCTRGWTPASGGDPGSRRCPGGEARVSLSPGRNSRHPPWLQFPPLHPTLGSAPMDQRASQSHGARQGGVLPGRKASPRSLRVPPPGSPRPHPGPDWRALWQGPGPLGEPKRPWEHHGYLGVGRQGSQRLRGSSGRSSRTERRGRQRVTRPSADLPPSGAPHTAGARELEGSRGSYEGKPGQGKGGSASRGLQPSSLLPLCDWR